MEDNKNKVFEAEEKRIIELLEKAKKDNDFFNYDKYIVELHKLRKENNRS